MSELKFRGWSNEYDHYCSGLQYDSDFGWEGILESEFEYQTDSEPLVELYTGLKDKNGDTEIYEYDIIDGEGNVIGNYHETPELLKNKTNFLIQGFGTKDWLTTYQEAVERGCHDAE